MSLVPNQMGLLARLPWSKSEWETQGRGLTNILRPQRSLQKTLYVTLITVPGTAAGPYSGPASCAGSVHASRRAVMARPSVRLCDSGPCPTSLPFVTAPPQTALFSAGHALQETARST